jgi:glycosyltransferase involved in cell wall biosynthesis
MKNIDISVVIPTFNRAESLSKTLDSMCNQTYPNDKYEIIVCDDSTTDETENVVKKYIQNYNNNIRYIKANSKTKGPANARNKGILAAFAPIVGFTDDDCIVTTNWIEEAKKKFDENENKICGLYGTVITTGNCKDKNFTISRYVCVQEDNGSYVTPNVFYRKDILIKVGSFDVTQRYLEDIELGWRVEKEGKIMFAPSVVVKHQILCLTLKEYISRLRVIQYWVMMYSKHPEHLEKDKDKFFVNRIQSKKSIYTILSIMTILSAAYSIQLFQVLALASILVYSSQYVFIDDKMMKYPKRFLKFPAELLVDTIRLYYSIKGCIKYKFFVIY